MNQLLEKFSNFHLALSYYENVRNFITTICSKYGLDVGPVTLYAILGCLSLLWIYYVSKRRPKERPRPTYSDRARCCFLGEIHGGDLVWQRLEEFNEAQVNPATLANTENLLKALLQQEHLDLMKLQQTVWKLEMSGSEDSAVKILKEAAKKAHSNNKPHEAYEIEMLLIEMLIYKGDLEKCLKINCLKDESTKDKRRPLYKAIIYKMLGDTEKATECWEEFVEVRDPNFNGASQIDFQEFEEKVDRLQRVIKEYARPKRGRG